MLPPASVKLTQPESWSSMARNFLRAAAQVRVTPNRTTSMMLARSVSRPRNVILASLPSAVAMHGPEPHTTLVQACGLTQYGLIRTCGAPETCSLQRV